MLNSTFSIWEIFTFSGAKEEDHSFIYGARVLCRSHKNLDGKCPDFSGSSPIKRKEEYVCDALAWLESNVGSIKSCTTSIKNDGQLNMLLVVQNKDAEGSK